MTNGIFKLATGLSVVTLLGGVVAYPAHAQTGSLAFSDGTDDFFSEVNPGVNDTFDIEFNPFDLNFVTTQSGDFASVFDGSPVQGVQASVGSFEFVEFMGSSFIYELTNDLVFDYDNGVTVTWLAGSEFEGIFNGPESVQFEVSANQETVEVTGLGEDVTVLDSVIQFSDTLARGGGTYNAQVDVTSEVEPEPVPEPDSIPLTMLGAGIAVALGKRFKSKLA